MPYDCGFAIVADAAAHRSAVGNAPAAYLVEGDPGQRDGQDYAPEASRRARAFPVYAALRTLGRDGIAALIDGCCDHALAIAAGLRALSCAHVVNEVVLNQVLVRFELAGSSAAQADALTLRVIAAVQRDGTCWAGPTRFAGRTAMRISVSNWRTSARDVEVSIAAIAAALDQALC